MNFVLSDERSWLAACFGFLADSFEYPLAARPRQGASCVIASEAKQSSPALPYWIASSLSLLAMTERSDDVAQRCIEH
jgi:hypothetical protein